jgi:dTDP-4-amino-4,6-dideoxygalactose transaminase
MDLHYKYKESIGKYLLVSPDNIFLYWKGRVALYALLKAVGIREGDEVLLSGLTCVVVPNAIIYLKAIPKYVDVSTDTYNPTFNAYCEKVTNKTKAIIIQNTFGLSSNVEEIVKFAKEKNLVTIEDCTHGFGGTYNNKPNGSYCDAAIYSTQWNKPFSTGIGGFCLLNNSQFISKIFLINKELITPTFLEEFVLSLQYWIHKNLINENNYWILRSLYRKLSKLGIVIGSSQGIELTDNKRPSNYFKGVSKVQLKIGIRNIQNLEMNLNKRRENAILYSEFLKLHNKKYISEDLWCNHSFLVYPLLVKDRMNFMLKAERNRIKIGDWFVSPIHPVIENFYKWDLNEDSIPVSSYLSKHLVNLPTLENDGQKVTNFLLTTLDNII